MRPIAFAFAGSLETPTGGYRYDRRVIDELERFGHCVLPVRLGDGFPNPDAATVAAAEAKLDRLALHMPIIIDGLAYGVMGKAIGRLARYRPLLPLVHHPLALETGLTPARVVALTWAERLALRHGKAVIVTSPATADLLVERYDVPRERITVALPGVDRPLPRPRLPGERFRFLTVGSLIPRKGHMDLIAAFGRLRDLDWEAQIIGDNGLDPMHAAQVAADIAARGLADRIALFGALSEEALAERYGDADCFVLASHYEGFGMAYTEAMVAGLPVIGTTGASQAIGDGGILIEPGDVDRLADLLRGIMTDPGLRADLLERARLRASQFNSWRDTARVISRLIQSLP